MFLTNTSNPLRSIDISFKKRKRQRLESNDLFGWRENGGRVKDSRVELAKNKLILC